MRVAESTEIFRPICHFGWAQASSGVALAMVASSARRKGPPDAVRMSRVTPSAWSPGKYFAGMHWKIALCSLSMGISSVPARRTSSIQPNGRSSPAPPCWRAAHACRRAPRPGSATNQAAPTIAAITMRTLPAATASASACSPHSTRGRRAAIAQCALRIGSRLAVDQHHRIRLEKLGLLDQQLPALHRAQHGDLETLGMQRNDRKRAATDAARRAENRNADLLTSLDHPATEQAERIQQARRPVTLSRRSHQTAVSRQQRAAVLERGSALEHALRQITDDGEHAHAAAERHGK